MLRMGYIGFFALACAGNEEDLISRPGNQIPSVPGIELKPAVPSSADNLVVEIVTPSADPDGDPIEYLVEWKVDGEVLADINTLTLDNMFTRRGETWSVTVTAFDGIESGGSNGKSVVIQNSPPTIDSIAVSPSDIYEKTEVTCVYDDPIDLDNDVLDEQQLWLGNDEVLDVGEVLTGAHFSKGDTVSCLVIADDGAEDVTPIASDSVVVRNSIPAVVGCVLEAEDNRLPENLPVVVRSTGWNDDDDDPEGYQYAWFVNSVMVSSERTLLPDLFGREDNVYVELTPWDGEDEGRPVRSPQGTGVPVEP